MTQLHGARSGHHIRARRRHRRRRAISVQSDVILIMGSNMAENHPVAFQWVIEARERGARVIHVDPRFSRTSAMADLWMPLRAGSDIVLLGALIHYVLEHGKEFSEYVRHYTNASVILREDFRDTEDLDGSVLRLERRRAPLRRTETLVSTSRTTEGGAATGYKQDRTLAASALCLPGAETSLRAVHAGDGRAGLRRLRRSCSSARRRVLLGIRTGEDRRRSATRSGWTQHSKGSQLIRTAAILQLLLGNIGRPGGGILALRGHASIQGSTDIPTLFDLLPGYLPMPLFEPDPDDLAEYVSKRSTKGGMWANLDKYLVSLLKAYYGDAATAENDFGFRLAAAPDRRPLPHGVLARDGGRQGGRSLCHGRQPGGRRSERRASSGARWRS